MGRDSTSAGSLVRGETAVPVDQRTFFCLVLVDLNGSSGFCLLL